MTCVGTLASNWKGLPSALKKLDGREEGDYSAFFEPDGKKSIHSWCCNTKSGKFFPAQWRIQDFFRERKAVNKDVEKGTGGGGRLFIL